MVRYLLYTELVAGSNPVMRTRKAAWVSESCNIGDDPYCKEKEGRRVSRLVL